MFESVFNLRASHRHRLAPLLREREAFLTHLQRGGTGRDCLRAYASRLNQIVRFLKLKKLRLVRRSEIKIAARRWANYRGKYRHVAAGPWSVPSFVWLAKRWFQFHGKLILPRQTFAYTETLDLYAEFLKTERRFSPVTIRGRLYQTRCFLRWLSKHRRKRELIKISLDDVDRYFAAMANRWGKVSLSSCAATLRAFFLYAESRRLCRAGMARGIKGPSMRQVSPAQKSPIPEWKEVLRLLHSTNGRTPIAIRARAILLLLCLYGLRRSEIVRLEVNDFDWKNHVFTVRRAKHGGLQQFPLLRKVSDAILRYIRNARPRSSCSHVFLSFHPPFGPMDPTSIYVIVSYRLKRLHIRSRHRGPHALRHACATQLLKRGIPPREIADFLGHRTCQSVGIYARFDMHSLQKVSDLNLSRTI